MNSKPLILKLAKQLGKQIGWSDYTLIRSLKSYNLSPAAARGMFPDGVIHVIQSLMTDWENRMSLQITQQSLQGFQLNRKIQYILQKRLSYQQEYIQTWSQAILIGLQPSNVSSIMNRLISTMNSVWEITGDQAQSLDWILKRGGLLNVFVLTEQFMLRDKSSEFQETYQFLDKQLTGKDWNSLVDFTNYSWIYQYFINKV